MRSVGGEAEGEGGRDGREERSVLVLVLLLVDGRVFSRPIDIVSVLD